MTQIEIDLLGYYILVYKILWTFIKLFYSVDIKTDSIIQVCYRGIIYVDMIEYGYFIGELHMWR